MDSLDQETVNDDVRWLSYPKNIGLVLKSVGLSGLTIKKYPEWSGVSAEMLFSLFCDDRKYFGTILLGDGTPMSDTRIQLACMLSFFITTRFYQTNKTPHILPTMNIILDLSLPDLLGEQLEQCLSPDELVLDEKSHHTDALALCQLASYTNMYHHRIRMKEKIDQNRKVGFLIQSKYKYLADDYLLTINRDVSYEKRDIDYLFKICSRILFSACFTLAVIQEKYPTFSHGNLQISKIVCDANIGRSGMYHCYHYNDKKWALAVNQMKFKLSGFYFGGIISENENPIFEKSALHMSTEGTQKDDISTLITSMYFLLTNNLVSRFGMKSMAGQIDTYFSRFTRIDIIKKMYQYHKSYLAEEKMNYPPKGICCSPRLLAHILTPHEYLENGHFDDFLATQHQLNKIDKNYNSSSN